MSARLPLWFTSLRHCLLCTCHTRAVWSSEPDNKSVPSIETAKLFTCLLKKKEYALPVKFIKINCTFSTSNSRGNVSNTRVFHHISDTEKGVENTTHSEVFFWQFLRYFQMEWTPSWLSVRQMTGRWMGYNSVENGMILWRKELRKKNLSSRMEIEPKTFRTLVGCSNH